MYRQYANDGSYHVYTHTLTHTRSYLIGKGVPVPFGDLLVVRVLERAGILVLLNLLLQG